VLARVWDVERRRQEFADPAGTPGPGPAGADPRRL